MKAVEVKQSMSRKKIPVENCINLQVEKTWMKMSEERIMPLGALEILLLGNTIYKINIHRRKP